MVSHLRLINLTIDWQFDKLNRQQADLMLCLSSCYLKSVVHVIGFLISRFHRDIYLMMYLWWSVGWKVKMHRDEWLGRDYFDRISGLECGWLIGEHEKFHCWQSFSTWPRKSSPEKCKKTQRNEWMKEWRYGKLDSIDNKTRLVVSGVCLVGCEWTFNYVLVTRIVKRDHYNASTNFLGWSDAKQH